MIRKSIGFLLGLTGLFGIARKQQLRRLDSTRGQTLPPRPSASARQNKYRGIEQILECPDPVKRAYMVSWGNTHLIGASADTRRKWERAAHDLNFRPHRRAA